MKLKRKYGFYAIFEPGESGGFGVRFPDVSGLFCVGNDENDAIKESREGLAAHLVCLEEFDLKIPVPKSTPESVRLEPGEKLVKIETDLAEFFPERFPERRGGARPGGGRPKKNPSETRSGGTIERRLIVRLTNAEFEALGKFAKDAGKTKSEYVRELIFPK